MFYNNTEIQSLYNKEEIQSFYNKEEIQSFYNKEEILVSTVRRNAMCDHPLHRA